LAGKFFIQKREWRVEKERRYFPVKVIINSLEETGGQRIQ
jgi:hypothetical protein